jgi:hypothetical protein
MTSRRRRFNTLQLCRACVRPAKPVLGFAVDAVRRRAVIALVTMIERTAVHPWHITPVHRRQRVPQFLVEQHAAVATAAAHLIAQLYRVDIRHGC